MTPPAPAARRLSLAAALLLATVVLVRPLPPALFGVDGACYARIARDLSARPLSTWADVRWMDGAFHEHPPLALWLEAAWFSVAGPSAAAAVWLARLYALALGVVVWLTARRLAGEQVAALSVVGLVTLPGFLQESQNPMLELPLTLALAVALEAVTRLATSRAAVAQYALAVVAAFWVKGPVALAGLGALAWAAWFLAPRPASPGRAPELAAADRSPSLAAPDVGAPADRSASLAAPDVGAPADRSASRGAPDVGAPADRSACAAPDVGAPADRSPSLVSPRSPVAAGDASPRPPPRGVKKAPHPDPLPVVAGRGSFSRPGRFFDSLVRRLRRDPSLPVAAAELGVPWGRLLAAGAAALGLGAVTVLGFEALCRAQGLAPYFGAYAQRQLIASFVEGRANPQGSPLYYLGTLVRWELALPLALPLVAFAWRRQQRGWRALVGLGLWQAAVVVVGFSLAKQKNEWYLAPLLPAAAWVVGGALAALPGRLLRVAPHAAALTAAGWLTFTLAVGTRADTPRQAAIRAVTVTPLDARGAPVANCSVLGDWLADHLFAFHWNAARVACDAPAAWRFDGRALTAAAPPH